MGFCGIIVFPMARVREKHRIEASMILGVILRALAMTTFLWLVYLSSSIEVSFSIIQPHDCITHQAFRIMLIRARMAHFLDKTCWIELLALHQ